jgi:stress-induced morphogen
VYGWEAVRFVRWLDRIPTNLNTSCNTIIADGAPNGKVMVTVTSEHFNDMNRLQQHRKVNEVLAEEMKDLHALQVDTQRTVKKQ